MKRLLILILLACGLFGCKPKPAPPPVAPPGQDYPLAVLIRELEEFEKHFGGQAFWFSYGVVAETGECELRYAPGDWESLTLSTSTTGQWERVMDRNLLEALQFYAAEADGVWVLPEYAGEDVFVAWEERK